MTAEPKQSKDRRVAGGIRLSVEHWRNLRGLARTHDLPLGAIVEALLDTFLLNLSEVEKLLVAKRLGDREREKENRRGKGRKKSRYMTTQAFTILLNDLTPEQLFTIAEAAWKMRGKTGSYEKTRTPRRIKRHGYGACTRFETLQQVRGLSSEQLQILADQIAAFRGETN
jgi:hypothetical protein